MGIVPEFNVNRIYGTGFFTKFFKPHIYINLWNIIILKRLLLDPFFQFIVGLGCPEAEQLTSAWSSRTTFTSLGSIIHSGGTAAYRTKQVSVSNSKNYLIFSVDKTVTIVMWLRCNSAVCMQLKIKINVMRI